jgi:hypothetical protein
VINRNPPLLLLPNSLKKKIVETEAKPKVVVKKKATVKKKPVTKKKSVRKKATRKKAVVKKGDSSSNPEDEDTKK